MEMQRNLKSKGHCLECDRPIYARLLCNQHYQASRRGKPATRTSKRSDCAVDGCPLPAISLNLCARHYARFRKHGDPLIKKTRPPLRDVLPDEQSPTKLAAILGVSRQRAFQLLNKEQRTAQSILNQAVKDGKINKPSRCERCLNPTKKLQGHHWNYKEPLDVRWVCQPCHKTIHLVR